MLCPAAGPAPAGRASREQGRAPALGRQHPASTPPPSPPRPRRAPQHALRLHGFVARLERRIATERSGREGDGGGTRGGTAVVVRCKKPARARCAFPRSGAGQGDTARHPPFPRVRAQVRAPGSPEGESRREGFDWAQPRMTGMLTAPRADVAVRGAGERSCEVALRRPLDTGAEIGTDVALLHQSPARRGRATPGGREE
jgi:hypothetical protein